MVFAWGYGGQMVYVLPRLGPTVVMTSDVGLKLHHPFQLCLSGRGGGDHPEVACGRAHG